MAQLVVGTAGHIDHGKTALVKALTGTDTDRLEEEKVRGMTIDLGFAFLNDSITIIDVPGHERFIRNMVAGVSTIQLGLLVIAADDGVMPQTREHLHVLSLLQVKYLFVALTKTDLAVDDSWLKMVEEDIQKLLVEQNFINVPIFPTSIVSGEGIDALKKALITKIIENGSENDRGFFRLPIDRVFLKKGFGLIVTGTVISGSINKGDELDLYPLGKRVKVRALQTHGRDVATVSRGDRAAVNISGADRENVFRGAQLAGVGKLQAVDRMLVRISMVENTHWKIKTRQRIRIHLGTDEIMGKVILFNKTLKSGDTVNALVVLERSCVAAADDRFVIRSYSPMETIGGGLVLFINPDASIRSMRSWVPQLSEDLSERLCAVINQYKNKPRLVRDWGNTFQISEQIVTKILKNNGYQIHPANNLVYRQSFINGTKKDVLDLMENYHKKNPYREGMSKEEIRNKLGISAEWTDIVLKECIGNNSIALKKASYSLKGHSLTLTKNDKRIADQLTHELTLSGYIPLSTENLNSLVADSSTRNVELLHVLQNQGVIREITGGQWITVDSLSQLKTLLYNYFSSNSDLSVPNFKELTKLTRKSAIPLLEYFDKIQFTERNGNVRNQGKKLEL
ncbi:MAG: selenocysteine-specific translation elongation factor [Candidatus Neomarinimicrobiota bacterium]